jgi:hypothetical protein
MKSRLAPYSWTKLPPKSPRIVHRWIEPYVNAIVVTQFAPSGAAGRVFLTEFEVENEVTVDGISVVNGDSVAGNITVGIYGPIITEETPLSSPVAAESASTALSGTNIDQFISFTSPARLVTGRYYAATEWSDTTARTLRGTNQALISGAGFFYDRGGGYGALTNPCPAVTATNPLPNPRVRCVP